MFYIGFAHRELIHNWACLGTQSAGPFNLSDWVIDDVCMCSASLCPTIHSTVFRRLRVIECVRENEWEWVSGWWASSSSWSRQQPPRRVCEDAACVVIKCVILSIYPIGQHNQSASLAHNAPVTRCQHWGMTCFSTWQAHACVVIHLSCLIMIPSRATGVTSRRANGSWLRM
jgi:hypothetical protein